MKRYDLLIITVVTFLTIVIWVASDIFHARSQTQVSPKIQQVIEPINPNFDLSALQKWTAS